MTRLLSVFAALASAVFLSTTAPADASVVPLVPVADGTVVYTADVGGGFGEAFGTLNYGADLFDLFVLLVFDPLDLAGTASASLTITGQLDPFEQILSGDLQGLTLGGDFLELLFENLSGRDAGLFGAVAILTFRDYDPSAETGTASVELFRLAPIPLPASALLLLSGLGGALVFARRRKAS